MSTNSANMFSVTDDGRLTETPKCTRTSPCSKADCLFCNGPASYHHVRDLANDLETTPTPKQFSKPTAPPDHFISTFTEEFQQALLGGIMEDIQVVLMFYDLQVTTCTDFFKFDRTQLMNLVQTSRELHKGRDDPQPTPIQTPPPPFQAFLQYENQQTGNSYLVR